MPRLTNAQADGLVSRVWRDATMQQAQALKGVGLQFGEQWIHTAIIEASQRYNSWLFHCPPDKHGFDKRVTQASMKLRRQRSDRAYGIVKPRQFLRKWP